MKYDKDFWSYIDKIVSQSEIVIDRPKGTCHPKYPGIKYIADYGYLKNTFSMDGDGIDIWRGSSPDNNIETIICTVDLLKKDSEIKILIGCTETEKKEIYEFHNNSEYMKGIMVSRY
ncbi:inorganic pyrophosphatase [Anaerocolumna xylanovorans]|uniref:Inorganic pyrophosphatase n=1 Tax=Anaerocolumna xylanovorans DSM 12503 TaxID=1121345 RepID=A0A1M7Y6P7_9FIRM|nr:inorganic pyrophosphatase [Anaerocolumna xylanovorans]SHO48327.1 inorganic pyrophosphatase [Anaerocolumna xylanovorans DSM 12503]